MQIKNSKKIKKVRMIAGPNGSGKSTLFERISHFFSVINYVNADEIEKHLTLHRKFHVSDYHLELTNTFEINNLINNHPLQRKAYTKGEKINITFNDNRFSVNTNVPNSYDAALIADIVRNQLIQNKQNLIFETVMSDASKIEFLINSKKLGYKNYLYYIGTESPNINIRRIKSRKLLGGHNVPDDLISTRYYKSLDLLTSAINESDCVFIFDNSNSEIDYILEIKNKEIFYHSEFIPNWVQKYILNKLKI